MTSIKTAINGLFCSLVLVSAPTSGEQLSWTPSEIMNVKTIKDVQISPDLCSALFVATESVLTEEKDLYLSKIYKASITKEESTHELTSFEATRPRWSPNGQWIAYLSENADKKKNLYLMDADGNGKIALTHSNEDVQTFRWSPDSSTIAFVMADDIKKEEPARLKLKSDAFIYKAEKKVNRLWLIDIHHPDKEPQPLTPPAYQVRGNGDFGTTNEEFDWSPDGKQIAFAYSPASGWNSFYTESSLAIVDVETGAVRRLENQAQYESMPRYSPDGQWISYMVGNPPEIYAFNRYVWIISADGKERRALSPTFNEGPLLAGPNLLGWTSDGNHVIFFEPKGTKYHLVILPKDGGPAKELMMKDWLLKEPAIAYNGNTIGFVGQSLDKPPEAFMTSLDSFKPKQISRVNEAFLSFPQIKTEVIRWQACDGIEIEGLLTFPVGYQPGKSYPLLLVIHGGPMGVFDESYIGTSYPYPLASFAEAGFMILRPNPRGSSGYGRKIRCLNYGDWGGHDFQDLMAGVDKTIEEGWADPNKLGIMGWSYGGYMTAWSITQTNRFKAASMGAGLSNLVSMAGTTDLTQFMPDYLGDFLIHPKLYHERSPLYHAAKVQTPCLIQHGMDDKRVPVSQAYEYYEALKRHDKEVTLVLYPRMGHRFAEPKMQLDLMERNLEWFSHYLLK